MNRFYRTDLLDVIDDFVVFKQLDVNDFEILVKKAIEKLSNRLYSEKHIRLTFDDEVFEFLGKKGFDKENGVKYLDKFIEKMVEFPLADLILKKKISFDNEVNVSLHENKLSFNVKR